MEQTYCLQTANLIANKQMNVIELDKIKVPKAISSEKGKNGSSLLELLNKDIKFSSTQLSDKKKEKFYSQLHILLSSGVNMKTALELFSEQQKKQDKELFEKIKDKVVNGSVLSEAMEYSEKFSEYEVSSIRIGEESGQLNKVLSEQAIFFTKKIAHKRQVIGVISYPSIVFLVAVGAVYFMLEVIVPMLSEVFKRYGGELPYLTRMVMKASALFSSYGLYMLLLIITMGVFLFVQRKTDWFRSISSRMLLRLPFFGNLIAKIYLARFCQSMNLLLGAKTPLPNALRLVKNMVGFYPIEKSIDTVNEDIQRGQPLHKTLAKFPIYNAQLLSLIKVAEEVNKLDDMFGKLAKQFSDETEHQTGLIGTVLEPLMILFIGLFVGVILIAMYLPMFNLSTAIQ